MSMLPARVSKVHSQSFDIQLSNMYVVRSRGKPSPIPVPKSDEREKVETSEYLVLILNQATGSLEVSLHHLMNERVEVHFPLPSENALCFRWVAEQEPGRMEM